MPPDETDALGISGTNRLANIERMLERILDKLESKADTTYVTTLESRIREMELHGSAVTTQLQTELRTVEKNLNALDTIESRVREIELHGSLTAIEASQEIKALHGTVSKLGSNITYATGALAAVVLLVNVGIRFVG